MASGADIVNGAYSNLGLSPSDSAITGSEMTDAIEIMNDMLIEWENSGIMLGFSPIATPADVISVPRGAETAIKSNLAGRLAPSLSKQISPTLAAVIKASTENLLRMIHKPVDVEYPDSLPSGSGNQAYNDTTDRNFFPLNNTENF